MLFKSVFARYMLAFVAIILVSFLVLSMIISNQVMNYSSAMKSEELSQIANFSVDVLESEYLNSNSSDLRSFLNTEYMMLQNMFESISSEGEDTNVFLVDTDGVVLWATQRTSTQGTYVERRTVVPQNIIDKALSEDYEAEEDTLGEILKIPCNVKSLLFTIKGEVQGIVFVATVSSSAYNFVISTVKTVVMSCMWVMCGAIIASYFISEKIVRPIRQMSHATKQFAQGKLDVRVPVKGNDEVAELAIAFNNMASTLEKNEETRQTFIANVSHDMRTPMTTIGGFIDAILDGTIPPEMHEHYLSIVSSEIKRLSRLVSTLLDISKIQAGERKFKMEPFDICELSRQIIISLEQRLTDKNLDVEFECDEDRMIAVADRDAIYQVLYNICDNGIKFSHEGGKYRFTVKDADKKILVSVYNEGSGIPKDDIPYVFDRFYKSDKSRGLDKTGVGLGMYISRTIIEAHGENITVRSKQDEFCEFTISLKKE